LRLGLLVGLLFGGAAASAAAKAPLGLDGCEHTQGVFQCSGLVPTWDGVPLDTTVTMPGQTTRRAPLVVEIHGFGNSKHEYLDPASRAYTDNAFAWARRGYAVLTYTARGLWGSCGTPESRLASPSACARGYIHLADTRYEVRDTQTLIGRLVDEGVADPRRIGVTGDSYGGGQSFALAALSDRVMLPDGRLVAWRSPDGTRLRIAAAAPVIPWTDLVGAIAPNGRQLSYAIEPLRGSADPVGVFKASVANAIFAAAQFATGPGQPVGEPFVPGRPMGYLAPRGLDPEADVTAWVARADAGEPYDDPEARRIVRTLQRFHSTVHVDASHRPPPLLVASGFNDDLFPAGEALRYVNRASRRYPGLPLSLLLGDFGHQRAANKARQRAHLIRAIHRWFDHYLLGRGRGPFKGATVYTQTCPREAKTPSPFRAATFAAVARGEVRHFDRRLQMISSTGGDPEVGAAIDPVSGGGDGCVEVAADPAPGTAVYELPPRRRPWTLVGAPTMLANLALRGASPADAQVAGRLWDVAPEGTQTLVARGLYRPRTGRNVWQLQPAAWRFAPGHVAKLELLGADPPFGRPSNAEFEIAVRRLQLRLAVRQRPDCRFVLPIARPRLPRGHRLAPGAPRRSPPNCVP
jgi:predicted acyl esterase